jgi:ArsR family transcriptional regulator
MIQKNLSPIKIGFFYCNIVASMIYFLEQKSNGFFSPKTQKTFEYLFICSDNITMESCSDHPKREETSFTVPSFEFAAELFSALGDPGRLKLLEYMSRGEACVSELAEYAGEGHSTISHRLKLLKQCRVVTKRREGKHIYYSLTDDHIRNLVLNGLHHAEEKGER